MIVSDSLVIADWTVQGTHPGRPIACLRLHDSELPPDEQGGGR